MPNYVDVQADIVPRLRDAQIAIDETTEPSLTEVEAIIDAAEGELHAYLRNRYGLPLSDVQAMQVARQIVVSLVCFSVFSLAYPQSVNNPFLEEARMARRLLRDLAEGIASLPNANADRSGVPEATFDQSQFFTFEVGEVL